MRALPLLGKAALAAALTMAEPLCAEAGIGEEMNRMFGDMTNVSEPGVYETQRRGVIAGGSVRNRSKIMTENPVSLTLPSVRAGCGGIDLFGGSLSFINGDQFIELLRSIASNAKGYAFQIALFLNVREVLAVHGDAAEEGAGPEPVFRELLPARAGRGE